MLSFRRLAGVDMMPTPQLREFEKRLFALKSCFQLGRPDLEGDPLCPHCGFRPAEEPAGAATAKQTVADLDEALDRSGSGLDGNAAIPISKIPPFRRTSTWSAMPPGKLELQGFLKSKQLPDPVSTGLREGASGSAARSGKGIDYEAELEAALSAGGLPCTVGELRERFDRYVAGLTKGKDVTQGPTV